MRALLFAKDSPVSRAQLEPFYLYRDDLRRDLGFEFEEWSVEKLAEVDWDELRRFDVVFIQVKYFRKRRLELLLALLQAIDGKKVILDDQDCSGRCAFATAPFIDLYVKKQVLRDPEGYRFGYHQQRIHAHYAESLDREIVPPPIDVPPAFRDKLFVGWNLGTARFLHQELNECDGHAAKDGRHRPIDVCMRVSLGGSPAHWYYRHRMTAREALSSLGGSLHVLSSAERVAPVEYKRELRESRDQPFTVGRR